MRGRCRIGPGAYGADGAAARVQRHPGLRHPGHTDGLRRPPDLADALGEGAERCRDETVGGVGVRQTPIRCRRLGAAHDPPLTVAQHGLHMGRADVEPAEKYALAHRPAPPSDAGSTPERATSAYQRPLSLTVRRCVSRSTWTRPKRGQYPIAHSKLSSSDQW